jgi:PAS domain S-box-containing protein
VINRQSPVRIVDDLTVYGPIGLVRIDTDLKVIEANAACASLLLVSPDEIAGSSIERYFRPDEKAEVVDRLRLLSTGVVDALAMESRALRSDLTTIWLRWTATAARKTHSNGVEYIIATFEDTTAKHEADVVAARNLNVLERLNRLKTEFLTTVSHEFRTALVGIQGFSELTRDAESLDLEEARSFANEVYNDARRLSQILDKMLDLDRVSGSRTVLHIGLVNMNLVVRDAVAAAWDEGSEHHLVTNFEATLPMVRGDPVKLRQVISILLSNAIKFSPPGSQVAISSRAEPGSVQINVKDHGVGMPTDFDEQLFGRYKWSADSPTTKVLGSGLGLPIAREIVELHGGRIWFDRVDGAGSEFHFTIPTEANQAQGNPLEPFSG